MAVTQIVREKLLARIAGKRGTAVFLSTLKAIPQWVPWKYGSLKSNGKRKKPPINWRTGCEGNPNDPRHWMGFESALDYVRENPKLAGLGFVATSKLNITGLDIDDCRDSRTGHHTDKAERILSAFRNTYAEVSPSSEGYRLFALGTIPGGYGKNGD